MPGRQSLAPLLTSLSQRRIPFGATTLGELAAKRAVLTIRCRACSHTASRDLRRLIVEYGRDAPMRKLKFACSRCGSTDVEVLE